MRPVGLEVSAKYFRVPKSILGLCSWALFLNFSQTLIYAGPKKIRFSKITVAGPSHQFQYSSITLPVNLPACVPTIIPTSSLCCMTIEPTKLYPLPASGFHPIIDSPLSQTVRLPSGFFASDASSYVENLYCQIFFFPPRGHELLHGLHTFHLNAYSTPEGKVDTEKKA